MKNWMITLVLPIESLGTLELNRDRSSLDAASLTWRWPTLFHLSEPVRLVLDYDFSLKQIPKI